MNTTALTGLAALIRGGLTGYKDAKGMQRQAALDEAQKRKEEESLSLRRAVEARMASQNAETNAYRQSQLAEKERAKQVSEFTWPVASEQGIGASEAKSRVSDLAQQYVAAPDYKRGPADYDRERIPEFGEAPYDVPAPQGALDSTETEDGPVVAFPESFVPNKQDFRDQRDEVLAARTRQLAGLADDAHEKKKELKGLTGGPAGSKPLTERDRQRQTMEDDKNTRNYGKDIESYVAFQPAFKVFQDSLDGGVLDNNALKSALFRVPWVRNFMDATDADARSAAEAILAEKMRQVSGLAVTESEAARQYMATMLGGGMPTAFMQAGWKRFLQETQNRIASVNARYPDRVRATFWERYNKPTEGQNPLSGPAGTVKSLKGELD